MSGFVATVYRKSDGFVVSSARYYCGEEHQSSMKTAALMLFGEDTHGIFISNDLVNSQTHLVIVLDGAEIVADRPELIVRIEGDKTTLLADGLDSIVLTGLPDPCEIILDDPDPTVETQRIEVAGGGFVFAAENPGVYTVEVIRFPFLPWKVEITAL